MTCNKGRRWSVERRLPRPGRATATNLDVRPARSRPRRRRGRARHRGDLPRARPEVHGARRPRGAALRRADQQPAAADALGHRAGQPPARARHRRRRRPRRRRRSRLQDHPTAPMLWYTRGTTDLVELQQRAQPGAVEGAAGPARSPPTSARAAPSCGRARDLPAPTSSIHVGPGGFYDNGLHEPTQRDVHRGCRPWSPSRSRGLAAAALGRPDLAPGDRRGLLRRRRRPRRDGRRACSGSGRSAARAPLAAHLDQAVPAARATRPTRTSSSTCALRPDALPPDVAPARWARARTPSSIRSCGSAASRACASSTPR